MQPDTTNSTMQAVPPANPANALTPAPDHCANCGAPLYGKYCYACGQSVHGLVRHFGSVMGDVADSVLNIDERLFKTLGPLYLRPGWLTQEYFAGRRVRYVTPFRLVFFLAIVAFFAIQLTIRTGFHGTQEAIAISTPGGMPGISKVPASKGLQAPISSNDDAFSHGSISLDDTVLWNRTSNPLRVRWLPTPAVDWLNDVIGNAQQQLHAMNTGSVAAKQAARRKFILGMFSAAPTVLFVLLPVFAFLLKLFYIFKKRLYMEHLIVAMHSHAFLMLSMLVLVVLGVLRQLLQPHAGWLAVPFDLFTAAAWIWVFVYLWLMQKRIYRQGWFMTNLKYWSLGFCYTILAGFGFAFAALISLTNG